MKYNDPGYSFSVLQSELRAAIHRVLESGSYILGPEVESFEAEWAGFVGAKYCVGVANGLDALTLSLMAHGIQPGGEVVVPSHTFFATWLAISRVGAEPVQVEPSADGFNLDITQLRKRVSDKTSAIVPVHLYGQPVELEKIGELAKSRDVPVIEDAAQAHGAELNGKRIGGFGHTACWSFYPGKNLGAFGDAGAITTDDEAIADKLRMLRNYGSASKYQHSILGANSRLDPLQAAVLRVKLRSLSGWNNRRREIASRYQSEINHPDVILPSAIPNTLSAWHIFAIQTPNRNGLQKYLLERQVETLVHYPVPPYRQPPFKLLSPGSQASRTDTISQTVLSLPIGPHLSEPQVDHVIQSVNSWNGT